MRRLVDHVLCVLPFEERWFRAHGCRAAFVGHPYFDQLRQQKLDAAFLAAEQSRGGRLVTLLPGSRTHEVRHNLPEFLKAATSIRAAVPDARFAVAACREEHARLAREIAAAQPAAPSVDVHVARTAELIRSAQCCLAKSGSVSLELLYHARPTAVLYKVELLTYALFRPFIRVNYVSLVNLLADDRPCPWWPRPFDPDAPGAERVPFPEYPTWQDRSARLAGHAIEWLTDEPARQRRMAQLVALRDRVAHGGAGQRAADYILSALGRAGDGTTPRHLAEAA
jgi:lipid-A-disaccharide synthase